MIGREEIERLSRSRQAAYPVLTAYVAVDPAWDAGREALLNDFNARGQALQRKLEKSELEIFQEDAAPVRRFLEDYDLDSRVKSLVFFSDQSENFFRVYRLEVPLASVVLWEQTPYIRPLLEVLEEYESYVVVLADRAKARMYFIEAGRIACKLELEAEARGHHILETGSDKPKSQMNIQRKSEEHAHWHYQNIGDRLKDWESKYTFRRLFIAGPVEVTRHLRQALPKQFQAKVAALREAVLSIKDDELLRKSLQWQKEAEREQEKKEVEVLITAARKRDQAALGVEAVLNFLQQGNVRKLFYSDDLRISGYQCSGCKNLFLREREFCPYCRAKTYEEPDLVEGMVEKVLTSGGEIEEIHGRVKDELKNSGGVGAYLRFGKKGAL